jgi:hypothetical protein
MKNFHQALASQNDLNSQNKSPAVREDRRYRHSFYWAGFVAREQ